ncbi:MAG: site-specific DNA-methyltransferase, partial [Victivallales bacterium]|nr:site-specific DNA-methyltransferase [Victivallales bacterium]
MSIRYIPFFPDPTHGQAILDNFKRTLRYSTSDDYKRMVRRGMPLYDLSTTETVGLPEENGNLLIHGECLAACAALRDMGRTVDLVYIDPPFASGADYAKKIFIRRNPQKAAELEEAEQTLQNDELAAFEEKMYGDVWEKSKYLNWMYTNLLAIKSVMSDNASIYVHLDWHIGHYVKILMDEVFGEENFTSEIIWKRTTSHSQKQSFANIHDTIFMYRKDADSYIWRPQFQSHSEEHISRYYSKMDSDGRRYTLGDLTAEGTGPARVFWGKEIAPPPGTHWRYSQENIDKLCQKGLIVMTGNNRPRYKRYLDSLEGSIISALWDDIPPVNSQANEAIDYATQKPEALLE